MTLLVRSYMNEDWPAGRKRYLDPAWLRYRVQVYLTYTVPSLLRQTDPDFQIWLDCRPGSEGELAPYREAFEQVGVRVTFDRGARFLNALPGSPAEVLVTRLDSDDCYAPDAVESIKRLHGERRATQFTDGYIFIARTRQAYAMRHRSPPFYTLRAKIDERGLVHPGHRGHNAVRDTFDPLILPPGRFCMVRHGKQGSRKALSRPRRWFRRRGGKIFGPGTEPWDRLVETFPLENQERFWRSRDCPAVHRLLDIEV